MNGPQMLIGSRAPRGNCPPADAHVPPARPPAAAHLNAHLTHRLQDPRIPPSSPSSPSSPLKWTLRASLWKPERLDGLDGLDGLFSDVAGKSPKSGCHFSAGPPDSRRQVRQVRQVKIYKEGGTFEHSFARAPCNSQAACKQHLATCKRHPCDILATWKRHPCDILATHKRHPYNLQTTALKTLFSKLFILKEAESLKMKVLKRQRRNLQLAFEKKHKS